MATTFTLKHKGSEVTLRASDSAFVEFIRCIAADVFDDLGIDIDEHEDAFDDFRYEILEDAICCDIQNELRGMKFIYTERFRDEIKQMINA